MALVAGFANQHLQHDVQLSCRERLRQKDDRAGRETVGRELWILFSGHHHYRDTSLAVFPFS